MNNSALKGKVSGNQMLKQTNQMLRRVSIVSNILHDFTCLTELNFEDGDSSQSLKGWVSSPEMK